MTLTSSMAPPYALLIFFLTLATAAAQPLSPSQSKSLLRLQRVLQYPSALSPLTPHTDFCSLPPSPSLTLSCSSGRLTTLALSGSLSSPLPASFSSDSLFTTLARFPALSTLSLVALGLHGPLPPKLHRLSALRSLNLSTNFFTGAVPPDLSRLTSLTTLVLSHNTLNATLPALTSLSLLSHLDLSSNFLGPEFPLLSPTSLTDIIMANNSFRKGIPAAIGTFRRLRRLDVSDNRLFGPIPQSIFSLPEIRFIDLSGNKLTGELPASLACGSGLAFVDLSRNLLFGRLPECIRGNSSGRVVLSDGNCLSTGDMKSQRPNSYCNVGALAAVLPPMGKRVESKSKLSLIAGIAAGVVGGAVVLGVLLLLVFKRGRAEESRATKLEKSMAARKDPIVVTSRTLADARHMSQGVRIGTLGVLPYRVFTLEELEEATNYFDQSNCIEEGPKGQFYKGWLPDGSKVLVRCLKLKQKHSSQTLTQYMDVISKLRHRHVVSILGHCIDNGLDNANTTGTVFLVLECVSNGTLRSHLTEWRKREMLKWRQRVAAVIGVARGIQFLHTVTVPAIVGNDLNIENILLDETLTAKINNYNLPVLPKNKNKIDSESPFSIIEDTNHDSIRDSEHGEKKDVYQLGLILLEVITGKPADSQTELAVLQNQLQRSLNEESEKLQEMTDPTIRGTFASESLRTAVELTLNCIAKDPKGRPSIDDVLWNLQYSVQVQDGWASSGNLSTQ